LANLDPVGDTFRRIEAQFLLDEAYDMTLQQDKREANLETLLGTTIAMGDSSENDLNHARIRWADHLIETRCSKEAEVYLHAYFPGILASDNYLNQAWTYLTLADCYHKQRKYTEEELAYDQGMKICETRLPEKYEILCEALEKKALLSFNIGHQKQHDKLFYRRIDIYENRHVLSDSESMEYVSNGISEPITFSQHDFRWQWIGIGILITVLSLGLTLRYRRKKKGRIHST